MIFYPGSYVFWSESIQLPDFCLWEWLIKEHNFILFAIVVIWESGTSQWLFFFRCGYFSLYMASQQGLNPSKILKASITCIHNGIHVVVDEKMFFLRRIYANYEICMAFNIDEQLWDVSEVWRKIFKDLQVRMWLVWIKVHVQIVY